MILTVDVGNTHTVIGLYQGKKLTHHWRILTEAERTADEYGVLLHSLFSTSELVFSTVQGIAVSCVVPPMTNVMEELMHKYFRISPLMVGPGIKTVCRSYMTARARSAPIVSSTLWPRTSATTTRRSSWT